MTDKQAFQQIFAACITEDMDMQDRIATIAKLAGGQLAPARTCPTCKVVMDDSFVKCPRCGGYVLPSDYNGKIA